MAGARNDLAGFLQFRAHDGTEGGLCRVDHIGFQRVVDLAPGQFGRTGTEGAEGRDHDRRGRHADRHPFKIGRGSDRLVGDHMPQPEQAGGHDDLEALRLKLGLKLLVDVGVEERLGLLDAGEDIGAGDHADIRREQRKVAVIRHRHDCRPAGDHLVHLLLRPKLVTGQHLQFKFSPRPFPDPFGKGRHGHDDRLVRVHLGCGEPQDLCFRAGGYRQRQAHDGRRCKRSEVSHAFGPPLSDVFRAFCGAT